MMEQFDVAIVGGGPAGSTVGTLLAKKGYKALIVEQAKFPRYHIGESMVPGILPVLEELGLTDEVARQGFVRKYGVTLLWGRHREPWTVYFGEVGPYEYTYQVERSEFDYLLLRNARSSGVFVLEESKVVDFVFEDKRCSGIIYVTGNSKVESQVRARYVIDASGQSSLLSRHQCLLEWDEGLKNIAVWAYYQGGKTLEGKDKGNILLENMPEGWLWTIPLHDGTQSVGWVMPGANVNGRKDLEETFLRMIDNSTETKRLLKDAQRVSDFHATRDWSYKSKQFYGPGFLLTGDAAGFVDPLFSTGVFLAMNGASLAAKAVEGILKEPARETVWQEQYEQQYNLFLDKVFSFVRYFYDASKDKEAYWAKAQELVDPIRQMTSRQDFIYMISGLGGVHRVMQLEPMRAIAELSTAEV